MPPAIRMTHALALPSALSEADATWELREIATANTVRQAPHTAESLTEDWTRPYDRLLAAFPAGVSPRHKYWPPVWRIDGAHGDRNLVCSCPAPEAFQS